MEDDTLEEDKSLKTALFQSLKQEFRDNLAIIRLNKAALTQITHALEDTIIHNQLPAMVFTGFQKSGYWNKEMVRYRELASLAQSICIFSAPPIHNSQNSSQTEVDAANFIMIPLHKDDMLRQDWFLVILTADFSILLSGNDCLKPVTQEANRLFDTFLSFEPKVIEGALSLIETKLAYYRPDKLKQIQVGRRLFPAVTPSPKYLSFLAQAFMRQINTLQPVKEELYQDTAILTAISSLLHESSQHMTELLILLEIYRQQKEVSNSDLQDLMSVTIRLKDILLEIRSNTVNKHAYDKNKVKRHRKNEQSDLENMLIGLDDSE